MSPGSKSNIKEKNLNLVKFAYDMIGMVFLVIKDPFLMSIFLKVMDKCLIYVS